MTGILHLSQPKAGFLQRHATVHHCHKQTAYHESDTSYFKNNSNAICFHSLYDLINSAFTDTIQITALFRKNNRSHFQDFHASTQIILFCTRTQYI